MPDLAIDLTGAARLGRRLARWAAVADDARNNVTAACALGALDSVAPSGLADLSAELERLQRRLVAAVDRAAVFVLPPIERLPPSTPFNAANQLASHNTYQRTGGLRRAHDDGFRAFELDLHIGAPTDLTPDGLAGSTPWTVLGSVLADAVTDGGAVPGDWHVFHHSADTVTSHHSLSEGLDELAALPGEAPLTLFLDLKDPLADGHAADRLDALLRERLGDRLYTPADLLARSAGAGSIGEAVVDQGWPTVHELQGRVLVVLTADVDAYRAEPPADAAAFVAVEPTLANLAAPDVVFFNHRGDRLSAGVIEAIAARSAMVRSWGRPTAEGLAANYVAID